eukprot:3894881-Amphidinium_carterae.1
MAWADGPEAHFPIFHEVGVLPISKSGRPLWRSWPNSTKTLQGLVVHEQLCRRWPRCQLDHCHADPQR